ncbi:hypothetical protein GXW82_27570 [Streptacidiphilus sp. 4-A2]|nr:hypothetical protein [Streptacidiphilus sp. 4-A2]
MSSNHVPSRRGFRRQRARPSRRAVLLRRAALGCGLVVVLGCVGGWGYVSYLDGNIRHGALSFGDQGPAQPPTASGGTALNILLIGSDTRDTAADLRLGGSRSSVGAPAHADVEMLLHVSADRSNASLISIPRDTMVDIPACTDPASGRAYPESPHEQITDSLSHGGPGCTVYTWHQLNGDSYRPLHDGRLRRGGADGRRDRRGAGLHRRCRRPVLASAADPGPARGPRGAGAGVAAFPARLRRRQRPVPHPGAAHVPGVDAAAAAFGRDTDRPGPDAVAGGRRDQGADRGRRPGQRRRAAEAGRPAQGPRPGAADDGHHALCGGPGQSAGLGGPDAR